MIFLYILVLGAKKGYFGIPGFQDPTPKNGVFRLFPIPPREPLKRGYLGYIRGYEGYRGSGDPVDSGTPEYQYYEEHEYAEYAYCTLRSPQDP